MAESENCKLFSNRVGCESRGTVKLGAMYHNERNTGVVPLVPTNKLVSSPSHKRILGVNSRNGNARVNTLKVAESKQPSESLIFTL